MDGSALLFHSSCAAYVNMLCGGVKGEVYCFFCQWCGFTYPVLNINPALDKSYTWLTCMWGKTIRDRFQYVGMHAFYTNCVLPFCKADA